MKDDPSTDKKLALSVDEAAKALGLGRNSAYAAIHEGTLPSIRFGKRLLVPRAALERLLSERPTTTAA